MSAYAQSGRQTCELQQRPAGFVLLVVMAMAEEGGGVGQACGLRTVRRRDELRVVR